jgi:hypothetical protein
MTRPRVQLVHSVPLRAEPARAPHLHSAEPIAALELPQIRACLEELLAVQGRVADQVRRRAQRSLSNAGIEAILASLARAGACLRQGLDHAPAAEAETICWLCHEPIVPGRLADPRDVRRHASSCAQGRADR